jgi:hypothetical protein
LRGGVLSPSRDLRRSAFHQLMQEHFPTFQAVYAQRYQERYGYWRPIVNQVVEAFLRRGDLQEGFARVRCADCGHELFVALEVQAAVPVPQLPEETRAGHGVACDRDGVRGGAALAIRLHPAETLSAPLPLRAPSAGRTGAVRQMPVPPKGR